MKSLLFAAASVFLVDLALTATVVRADTIPKQKTLCNTGYSVPECIHQLSVLREALKPYHPERLGEWTWVLVKSADWKAILLSRGLNPNSPAFTVLGKRQTFLEEALFVRVPNRSAELLRFWSVPLDKMLDFAITHELGHAICNLQDEHIADSFGRQLREGKSPECVATHSMESHSLRQKSVILRVDDPPHGRAGPPSLPGYRWIYLVVGRCGDACDPRARFGYNFLWPGPACS